MQKIHMIAICGTGMGSLAGLLSGRGHPITGSDLNVYPPMSTQLEALGIKIIQGFDPKNIEETNPDLVIIGNAVSKDNPEVQEVMRRKLPYYSMPQAIEELFLKDKFPIVIAGTHGKTTTSSIAAWLLERTGQSPSFLVGGILKNFNASWQVGAGDYFVIEGDEYDSAFFDKEAKFLHYHPQILLLNPVEFDHADIYRDLEHVLSAFQKLVAPMPPSSLILASHDCHNMPKIIAKTKARIKTFGLSSEADVRADNVQFSPATSFDLVISGKKIARFTSPLLGEHNLKNLLGVLGILIELGINPEAIQTALDEFQGVKRRQEILATVNGITIIDDFAHHPTAIRETIAALRKKYVKQKLWILFEPRSNTTRRKVFEQEFLTAFDQADEILFAPPYAPEKIPEEERLDPEKVIQGLIQRGKKARLANPKNPIDEIVEQVATEARDGDVVCIMSNGGFGGIYQKLIERLQR